MDCSEPRHDWSARLKEARYDILVVIQMYHLKHLHVTMLIMMPQQHWCAAVVLLSVVVAHTAAHLPLCVDATSSNSIVSSSGGSGSRGSSGERGALDAMFTGLNGAQWRQRAGWQNSSAPLCHRYGVQCCGNST